MRGAELGHALAGLLAANACVPESDAPEAQATAAHQLVIELTDDVDDAPRAWDGSAQPFVFTYRPGATIFYLAYDRPLPEEGIDVGRPGCTSSENEGLLHGRRSA